MTTETPVLLWFRRDLRLADNPALGAAIATGRPVLPVYIHDEGSTVRMPGAASRWWLDKSLRAFGADLADRGATLILRRGDSEAELRRLIDDTGADAVFMNRLFEPDAFARDADIAHGLKDEGVECRGFNGSLLRPPGTVLTGSDLPYRVFTPFRNKLLGDLVDAPHTPGPRVIRSVAGQTSDEIDSWALHPSDPDWSEGFDWAPGEAGVSAALSRFLSHTLKSYSHDRDHPGPEGGSRLSPYLHFGEIAPWRIVERAKAASAPKAEIDKFITEVAWREFSAHLLSAFPQIVEHAFNAKYDAMPWRDDEPGFAAWTRGKTGFPIVDAGMRELWATGFMHNRVRMIAASFLVKDLLIDWRRGERWFWDTLVDADLANNVQNWQWVAGSGADAAPYFRIFNPVTQGQKFDAEGLYVRKWVPELARLPDRWLHAPWTAPGEVLSAAGVSLGRDYPRPIVDHAAARDRALEALKGLSAE